MELALIDPIAGRDEHHCSSPVVTEIRKSREEEPRPTVKISRRSHEVRRVALDSHIALIYYRFIDSEADLDLALKALLPLSQAPVIAYPELVSSGAVSRLIGLLSHENADIVIDVVEVIHELTDEDVGNEVEDEDEEEGKREESLKILMEGLVGRYHSTVAYGYSNSVICPRQLENSILELLVDNLKRLNEAEESDRQGVFHILGMSAWYRCFYLQLSFCVPAIFENFVAFRPELASLLITKTTILQWLLTRIQSATHDENRGYSAELLSILLQNNRENRLALGKQDGVEIMLKVLSVSHRRGIVAKAMTH